MDEIDAAIAALALTAPIWLWFQVSAVDTALRNVQAEREAQLTQLWDRR